VILHIVKVFLDDLNGTNLESLAALLEGCGKFLLRGAETGEKTASMVWISFEVDRLLIFC